MKLKIGIVFGGFSREREISFAGGRTVYDNLNKSLFEAVPLFIDSFGNFIELDWKYIYKGSIRDFYPPVSYLKESPNQFQVYAESITTETHDVAIKMAQEIGKIISPSQLKGKIDFAFLCLHGPFGEDGTIQGLLDFYGIPYSGSGVYPSAVGINKIIQKQLMSEANFNCPQNITITKDEWNESNRKAVFDKASALVNFPMVVKAPTQGSSIGISILKQNSFEQFCEAINKSFFRLEIKAEYWLQLEHQHKIEKLRQWCDIREGIGMPVQAKIMKLSHVVQDLTVLHPEDLLQFLNQVQSNESIIIEALDSENEVLIEQFIQGKEFSCIVVEHFINGHKEVIALPPTEIKKAQDLFDYRSKYLPGLARKITPIDLPLNQIQDIASACKLLFKSLRFDVYARIDGFINDEGEVFLNDPNTTSGMMPSSFFFHQAAEIGLNPSQFLTYIISTSLKKRAELNKNQHQILQRYLSLNAQIAENNSSFSNKIKVAVILGGYSSERHISVESGRNIYEKLASSEKYFPIPIFLTGNNDAHQLFMLPINILLKDNADDIKEKVTHYFEHPFITSVKTDAISITNFFTGSKATIDPQQITYEQLKQLVDIVFIALHGRPGEDGAVQAKLDDLGIPYNGSGVKSSQTTINKYLTNEILMNAGMLAAKHMLVNEQDWQTKQEQIINKIENDIKYPLIAKPVDDGCSSAVKKIKSRKDLISFASLIFRDELPLIEEDAIQLKVKANEEFPQKREFLIEELISANGANHFIEVTGGMLTRFNANNEIEYEIFEASETLAEGEVLSLEEKFLAGQGQNITPARYATSASDAQLISDEVKSQLHKAAKILNIEGYARIDAFVRIFSPQKVEVIFIEVNSLPGMTPATCIFHQTAINGYKPFDFIDRILDFGFKRKALKLTMTQGA
ncbi:MAG TPA: D-alanine--D-alanine ligase [Bacteroidia bacterium]|nr:D-alanine--D-alanine ligase [Bacteroidia bacterium]